VGPQLRGAGSGGRTWAAQASKAYKIKGEWVMVPTEDGARVPMALRPGDIIAIRQQNFPYEKRLFWPGAPVGAKFYFARESDANGVLGV